MRAVAGDKAYGATGEETGTHAIAIDKMTGSGYFKYESGRNGSGVWTHTYPPTN